MEKKWLIELEEGQICPCCDVHRRSCNAKRWDDGWLLQCEGKLGVRPLLCPIEEHDISVCHEKYKEDAENMTCEASKRLGW